MLYTVLYMAATRTQVYLTPEQRDQIELRMRREDKSLAQIIRDALDAYFGKGGTDGDAVFGAAFGRIPDLEVPSRDEWDRGHG